MSIINGIHITKDWYDKLHEMKSYGVKLTYGSNHNTPIGYTSNKGTSDAFFDIKAMKGIPKYFYDNLYIYSSLFNNNNIDIFVNDKCVEVYPKVLKYKSISINPV